MAAEERAIELQTVEYVLAEAGGSPVGILDVTEQHADHCRVALEGAGYRVHPVQDEDEPPAADDPTGPRIDLDGGTCTVEEHLPCDINLGISVAADVARDLGLPIRGTLARIQRRRYTSVDEARQVLQTWSAQVRSAPGADEDQLGWADVVVSEVFGREPETVPEG